MFSRSGYSPIAYLVYVAREGYVLPQPSLFKLLTAQPILGAQAHLVRFKEPSPDGRRDPLSLTNRVVSRATGP